MKRRLTAVVRGRVQGVGYRDRVWEKAVDCGVTGFVENQRDGSVLIVAEGEETALTRFISEITIKQEAGAGLIHVQSIETTFSDATGGYSYFEVKTGDLSGEMREGFRTAYNYLGLTSSRSDAKLDAVGTKLTSQLDAVGDKLDSKLDAVGAKLDSKLDSVGAKLDSKLDSVGTKLDSKLDSLGGKIDSVKKVIDESNSELKGLRKDTSESFGRLDSKYGVMHGEMMDFNRSVNELIQTLRDDRAEIKKISSGITRIADRIAP